MNRRTFLATTMGALTTTAFRGSVPLLGRPPSGLTDYEAMDAIAFSKLVRTKQVSPEELLEHAITRCEAINPIIKAVSQKYYDMARQTIRTGLPDGPLRGVPFLLKDMGAAMNVPLYRSKRGVPNGLQFAGRYGEDALLLQLAGQLERAQPWITKPSAQI